MDIFQGLDPLIVGTPQFSSSGFQQPACDGCGRVRIDLTESFQHFLVSQETVAYGVEHPIGNLTRGGGEPEQIRGAIGDLTDTLVPVGEHGFNPLRVEQLGIEPGSGRLGCRRGVDTASGGVCDQGGY